MKPIGILIVLLDAELSLKEAKQDSLVPRNGADFTSKPYCPF